MKQVLTNIISVLSKKEKQQLLKFSLLDILVSLLDIFFLVALLFVINYYTQPDKPLLSFAIFKEAPLSLIIIFFVLFSLKNLFGFLVFKNQYNYVYGVAARISADNLLHYLKGSFHSYVSIDSSIHIRKISQQPIEFCHYVLNGVLQVFSQAVLVLLTVLAIVIYNPILFPLLLLALVPPLFLIAAFMKKKLASSRQHGKITSEKTIQHLQEALSAYIESNVYGRTDFFTTRYRDFQAKLNFFLAEKQVIQQMPSRLIEVFAVFGLLFLVVFNMLFPDTNALSLITIGAFMAAAYKIIPGVVKIMNTVSQVKTYRFTLDDLLYQKTQTNTASQQNRSIFSIRFNKVDFRYNDESILDSFDMEINNGDIAGISGSSGKGKTTIANLLLGFISPAEGTILYNGEVTDAIQRQAYWNKVAYIKQQPFFIHDSIIKNICLEDDEPDWGKLNKIVSFTGVDKLATSFDDLKRIVVTENGKNFSGGQRQRIIFARALYKDAELLILDEPFNELDETSEKELLNLLKQLAEEGKIILLITHNKESLSFCNKIIMMDERGK